jgi:hypothetical protein
MMRVATGLLCLCFSFLACKGSNFADKSRPTHKSGDAAPVTEDEEAIALEPTSVGGAYLGCFADPQISSDLINGRSADEIAVGCQVFEDPHFNHVKESSGIVLDSGEVDIAGSRRPLVFQTLNQHPRWLWVTKTSVLALHANIFLQARASADSNPVQVRVELLDILPSGLVTEPEALLTGVYKLRLKDTIFCAHGNPEWGWDAVNNKPIVEPVLVDICAKSLNFRFTRFENGLRIHVPNPKPLTCDTQNYAVEHCNDSCVDLEAFGRGSRVVLWACTKSVEAQSYSLLPSIGGSVRIQGNGRPLTRFGGLLIPDLGTTVDFEIVPVAP